MQGTAPQLREALLEEHLEVGHAAPLQEHVPVGAGGLDELRLGLLAVHEQGALPAAALPHGGDVRLGGEGELGDVALRALVARELAGGELDALEAELKEFGRTDCAAPVGVVSTGDAASDVASRALKN